MIDASCSFARNESPCPETITIVTTAEDHRIARLTAAAIGLSLIDAAIPLPLPGVKPGLASIVTLIVLARYGWGTAAWVSIPACSLEDWCSGNFCRPDSS